MTGQADDDFFADMNRLVEKSKRERQSVRIADLIVSGVIKVPFEIEARTHPKSTIRMGEATN